VDLSLIIAGVLLLVWPAQHEWSMRRIRGRMAARGSDPESFRHHMDRRWIRVALMVAPVVGLICIVLGLLG
jgi:hypothetical protein